MRAPDTLLVMHCFVSNDVARSSDFPWWRFYAHNNQTTLTNIHSQSWYELKTSRNNIIFSTSKSNTKTSQKSNVSSVNCVQFPYLLHTNPWTIFVRCALFNNLPKPSTHNLKQNRSIVHGSQYWPIHLYRPIRKTRTLKTTCIFHFIYHPYRPRNSISSLFKIHFPLFALLRAETCKKLKN